MLFRSVIKILVCCCTLFLGVATSYAVPGENLLTWENIQQHSTSISTVYLREEGQLLTLKDAQNAFAAGAFKPTPEGSSFGFMPDRFWFHFALSFADAELPQDGQAELYLAFEYTHLDNVVLYRQDSSGVKKTVQFGDVFEFGHRNIATNSYLLPVKYMPGETIQYWLEVDTSSSMQMPISVWSKDRYLEQQSSVRLAYGLYLGVLVVMGLYNLFLGFSIRDISYFHYVGYIMVFAILQVSIIGYGYQYLWPKFVTLNQYSIPSLIFIALFFASMFGRSFLQTKVSSPAFDRVLGVMAYLNLLAVIPFFYMPYRISVNVAIWSSLVTSSVLLIAGFCIWLKGYQQARFFVFGWAMLLFGSVIFGFAAKGVLPLNFFTQHAAQVGSALEVILLSLALADRINRMTREKQVFERSAKIAMQRKNSELEALLKQLNESNAIKDSFLATISHELRTPMNGIEGSLQVIEDATEDVHIHANLQAAKFSAHHMTQLVESLLEYSELLSGHFRLEESEFDMAAAIRPLVLQAQMQCEKKGIQFIANQYHLTHNLLGDSERLQHLLFQLLDNAIKFTHQGCVKLDIIITESQEGATTRIQVSDTGIGIEPETCNRIFETFSQADSSFSRQYGGLGIGLTLTKALVDKMGGTVVVESELAKGSVFTVDIPWRKGGAISLPNKTPDARSVLDSGKQILIVEDNPVNQMTLRAMVKKLGYEVVTANNGQEALSVCNEQAFDCILMDCQMPIMDGFEATRRLREGNTGNAKTPIVAVTANAMSQDRERCLTAGMNDYIKKPVSKDLLGERIHLWINRGSGETASKRAG